MGQACFDKSYRDFPIILVRMENDEEYICEDYIISSTLCNAVQCNIYSAVQYNNFLKGLFQGPNT